MLKINSDFLNSIKEAQKIDVKFVDLMVASNQTLDGDFKVDDQGVLRFRGRICIPDDDELKKLILEESHRSSLSIHLGATKMYHDLKKLRGKDIPLVKVVWGGVTVESLTWELESKVQESYPELFA